MIEMKKVVCLLIVMMLCMSLVLPAYAAEDSFVPSITYKPTPELVPVIDENQEEHVGIIVRDENGEILGYVDEGCLRITPVAHIWDDTKEVPEVVRELLETVYNGLNDGSIEISYDKHGADLDPANMVIRDLFDARFGCEECEKLLEPEGAVMELTFDLGVVADAQIYVQTYDEATGEWTPVVKTVNNGDGTVTCTFEHLCAIEFSMVMPGTSAPVEDAPQGNALPWIIALLVAAAAAVVVVVIIAKNKKKAAV